MVAAHAPASTNSMTVGVLLPRLAPEAKDFVDCGRRFDALVTAVTWQLGNSGLVVERVACEGMVNVRSLEFADIALGAATIIVMLALLLVSMPGWQ